MIAISIKWNDGLFSSVIFDEQCRDEFLQAYTLETVLDYVWQWAVDIDIEQVRIVTL